MSLWTVPTECRCWNAASAKCGLTHEALAKALREYGERQLLHVVEGMSALRHLLTHGGRTQCIQEQLVAQVQDFKDCAANLTRIGELAKEPLDSVAARLEEIHKQCARAEAELDELSETQQELALPSAVNLLAELHDVCAQLNRGDWQAKQRLRFIVPKIMAIPHQQFGSNLVVLRARFEVSLIGLLPASVRLALQRFGDDLFQTLPECFRPVILEAELFGRSAGPKHGVAARALAVDGLPPTAIGNQLGISKRNACIARDYGESLEAAGRTDPYIELTEPPVSPSRWRPTGRKGRKTA